MKDVIPNYFIVGAHKCGTTFMAEHLRQHPEVFMTEPKEPQHFSRDICPEFSAFLHPSRYQALYAGVRNEKAIGEASTWYLYSQVAADAIHRVNPDARIIVMLRNPVDFLHSMHSELLFGRHESIPDFERAIDLDYRGRRRSGVAPTALFECGFEYRKSAHFCHQIERYLSRFGREQMHFVLLDDIRESPEAAFAGVLRFLGVDDSFRPDFKVTNANKQVRAPWVLDILYFQSSIKSMVARSLPAPIRRRLIDAMVGLATQPAPREPMPRELRRRLTAEYEGEVAALAALLGRDLSRWSDPAAAESEA